MLQKLSHKNQVPPTQAKWTFWNDYSFISLFCLQDENDATTDDWTQQKAPKYEFKTPPKSTNLKITASQKVVKKYRKYVKNAEFRRLKSIVPTLAKKNDASKVSLKKFEFSRLKLFFADWDIRRDHSVYWPVTWPVGYNHQNQWFTTVTNHNFSR